MMKPTIDKGFTKKCATEDKSKHSIKKFKPSDNKCADCNQEFKLHYEFVRHAKKHHPNGKAFECNDCGARFSNTQALSCHRRVINNVKQSHVCKFCAKSFLWASGLKRHLSLHSGDLPYNCPFCTAMFKDKRTANKHQQKCFKNTHACKFCDKVYKHDRGLLKHLELHAGEKPYFCTECEKSFKRRDMLEKHQITHTKLYKPPNNACGGSGSVEKQFMCKFCAKTFDFESLLKYHLRVHTGERPYSCSICKRTYIRQKDLNKHQRKGHKSKYGKDLTCKHCNRIFERNFSLQIHLKLHEDDSAFSCSICGEVFKQKHNLKKHLNTHLQEETKLQRKRNANILSERQNLNNSKNNIKEDLKERGNSKKEANNTQLKTESKDSNRDKMDTEIICKVCSKTFKRKHNLKKHLKTHLQEEKKTQRIRNTKILSEKLNLNNAKNNNIKEDLKERGISKKEANKPQLKTESKDSKRDKMDTEIICEICSKTFTRSLLLKLHLEEHTNKDAGTKRHQKNKAEHNSSSINNIKEQKTKNVCEYCSKTFKRLSHLEIHLRLHTEELPYSCCVCEKSFKDESTLNKHQKIHPKEKLQECSMDLKIWRQNKIKEMSMKTKVVDYKASQDITNTKLSDNTQENKGKPSAAQEIINLKNIAVITDNTAEKSKTPTPPKTTRNIENVIDISENEISLDCNDIEIESVMNSSPTNSSPIENIHSPANIQSAKQKAERQIKAIFKPQLYRGLNRSFKVQDTAEQRNYPCCLCDKSYTESRLLKEHQKVHLKQKPKNVVKPLTKTTNSLQTITKIKIEPASDVDYLSDTVTSNNVLDTIKTEYMDETPDNSTTNVTDDLKCQFCYKIFLDSETLANHIKVHFGDRFFSCSLCERSYTNKLDLMKHKRIHLKI